MFRCRRHDAKADGMLTGMDRDAEPPLSNWYGRRESLIAHVRAWISGPFGQEPIIAPR